MDTDDETPPNDGKQVNIDSVNWLFFFSPFNIYYLIIKNPHRLLDRVLSGEAALLTCRHMSYSNDCTRPPSYSTTSTELEQKLSAASAFPVPPYQETQPSLWREESSERRHWWDILIWPPSSHTALSAFSMSRFYVMKEEEAQFWGWTKPPQLKLQTTPAWELWKSWIFDWGQFCLLSFVSICIQTRSEVGNIFSFGWRCRRSHVTVHSSSVLDLYTQI